MKILNTEQYYSWTYLADVKNLFFLSSSCIYPKYCKQPMKRNTFDRCRRNQ